MTDNYPALILDDDDYSDLRDTVRKICEGFPGAYWRDLEDRPVGERYPKDFVQALMESGFLAALIPEEYGGVGLPVRAGAVILETIHESGCNASACHAQMYVPEILVRHGSNQQKQEYLPRIAAGELRIQAFGFTDPAAGPFMEGIEVHANRSGDDYVISGQKAWVSHAMNSDLMLLLARTTPEEKAQQKSDGVSLFMIDVHEALKQGMKFQAIDTMINDGGAKACFDNLPLPGSARIGEEGKGADYFEKLMNVERIMVAGEAIGDARFFSNLAVSYANERIVFERPIGKNQGIQFPIAKSYMETRGAELVARKAAALYDAGIECSVEANMAKHLAVEAAWETADVCFTTHGGFAFAREYNIERKWRDVRVLRMASASTNSILALIGEKALGLPRSY